MKKMENYLHRQQEIFCRALQEQPYWKYAMNWNIPVEEKLFTVDELKQADAAFFCGTAAEVIGWESLDDVKFPKHWNEIISKRIQEAYMNKVKEKKVPMNHSERREHQPGTQKVQETA